MKPSTRFSLVGIAALAVLSLVHFARRFEHDPGVVAYLLGVLPNVTAAIAIPFVALSIWADQRPAETYLAARQVFIWLLLATAAALIGWEMMQQTSRTLIYDPHDIGGTFVGLAVAVFLFNLTMKTRSR
ncbi:hypothetical protein ACHAC9_10120 [Massilia sp. CMS3.1]|uniref:hypothetical protein n=1 Tax=Massilia sp. CMS3.1 TaxID=3373083 RepID=UPI003EE50A42